MDNLVFNLSGTIPSKKNSKRILLNKKTGKPFISCSGAYKSWHDRARYEVLQHILLNDSIRHVLPIGPCKKITVHLFFGDKRKADNTNKVESVHDLLVDCGVLKDDSWDMTGETHQIPVYRKGEPGAKVEIEV